MRTALIHPTAIIHSDARLAPDVEVGPWTIIGADVEIGSGTVIESHVVIKGPTRIGAHNHIFQFSTIGEATPDLKYKGEPTRLVIGDHNIIREGVTIHRGTVQDRSETTIGDHNLLMAYVHIGHDSVVGNHCILVNNTALAGHVHIGDWAILSGFTLVHQYCHIGAHSFTGMGTALGKDLPAYVMANGNPAEAKSINAEGLKRRGFDKSEVATIQKAFKILYRRGLTLGEALTELEAMATDCEALGVMVDSIRNSSRGIVR
ncbi:acyl-ACP--UDP-N-acetylglucosamine O-acyltransferase [Marinimicrobium sp. LS-A18]|uniref:acyl-ACP--UDP-N-acetylglucosamine O-acyltransferase n=1 Tax=Marinimicrobium sp. LS-A18 TaxID=1381596 RepID=UPI0004B76146|nr:acyl-ACP--UDP-N-acetylglucosamine O-acyltransferase [Marinimicrobium sp. LS-A18]